MGPSAAHPSFSFATYQGKSAGEPATWTAFWGTYTFTMNVEMLRLLIDSIDDGEPDDGLDDSVYDLVEALENLLPDGDSRGQGDTKAESTDLFSITTFNNTFTVQCRVEGLTVLHEAVCAGADYDGRGGSSLYAFTGQCANLIKAERDRKQFRDREEEEPAPQGYVQPPQRRRRRRSEVQPAQS